MIAPPFTPRRKAIPDRVKVEVLLCMLGLKGKKIDWSHEPALGLRAVNDAGTDYVPPQLDPDYIFARMSDDHDKLTFTDNGTGRSDLAAIAHVRRSGKADRDHKQRMAEKGGTVAERIIAEHQKIYEQQTRKIAGCFGAKRKIPSRPFPKGHRQLRSRNDLGRRK